MYKALFTENYYEMNAEKFYAGSKWNTKNYMNFEKDLQHEMKLFNSDKFTKEAYTILENMYADKIIAAAEKELKKEMQMVVNVLNGKSSLGYTNAIQECHALYEMRTRFEFNC